jgi:hypothetical protein
VENKEITFEASYYYMYSGRYSFNFDGKCGKKGKEIICRTLIYAT